MKTPTLDEVQTWFAYALAFAVFAVPMALIVYAVTKILGAFALL